MLKHHFEGTHVVEQVTNPILINKQNNSPWMKLDAEVFEAQRNEHMSTANTHVHSTRFVARSPACTHTDDWNVRSGNRSSHTYNTEQQCAKENCTIVSLNTHRRTCTCMMVLIATRHYLVNIQGLQPPGSPQYQWHL